VNTASDFMERKLLRILRSILGMNNPIRYSEPEPDSAVIDLLRTRLNTYMIEQKPFLKPHYKLKDLSNDLQMPLHQLSAFLNKRLGMHFTDYLNQFRIKYCEELIKNEQPGKLNLKELVPKCGFHNRNTFTTAFKKFTGKTPADYIRNRYLL
jgi:AraC-like DNA-binding protein